MFITYHKSLTWSKTAQNVALSRGGFSLFFSRVSHPCWHPDCWSIFLALCFEQFEQPYFRLHISSSPRATNFSPFRPYVNLYYSSDFWHNYSLYASAHELSFWVVHDWRIYVTLRPTQLIATVAKSKLIRRQHRVATGRQDTVARRSSHVLWFEDFETGSLNTSDTNSDPAGPM